MEKTEHDALLSSITVVIVFGILGNILVILSILGQKKKVLKNNYYFLVLNLAISDLAALIKHLFVIGHNIWPEKTLSDHFPMIICNIYVIGNAFEYTGVGIMLIISLLRYRAIVHPLKPAISKRKMKVVCGLVYLVGFIMGGGILFPRCFIKSLKVAHGKFYLSFWMFFAYFIPTIFMAVVYYKICRSLIKQREYMKRVCSNAVGQMHAPVSSFNILSYVRNRRSFLVCLSIVFCYGIAYIPESVWYMWFITGEHHLRMKYVWVGYFAHVLGVAGSHSLNPLIYGILDKQLLPFWKCCCKKKRKTQESQAAVVLL